MDQTNTALIHLSDLAREQVSLEADLARLEKETNALSIKYKTLTEVTLPAAMADVAMKEFTTQDGFSIQVGEKTYAHISADRNKKAIAWLDEHGCENLPKRKLVIEFEKSESSELQKIKADLSLQGFRCEVVAAVHPKTLSAWAKERLAAGLEIDMALFGVHVQKFSKVEIK